MPKNLGEGAITEQYGRPSAASPRDGSPSNAQTLNFVNGAPCSAGQDARQDILRPGTVLAVPQFRVSARWISCPRVASLEV
jgi:hypothetical protein